MLQNMRVITVSILRGTGYRKKNERRMSGTYRLLFRNIFLHAHTQPGSQYLNDNKKDTMRNRNFVCTVSAKLQFGLIRVCNTKFQKGKETVN